MAHLLTRFRVIPPLFTEARFVTLTYLLSPVVSPSSMRIDSSPPAHHFVQLDTPGYGTLRAYFTDCV